MKRLAALVLAVGAVVPLAAQDSQFGIRGLGTPGRWESVRARSTGGAFASFDPFSPLIEASIADLRRTSAGVTLASSWRDVTIGGLDASLRNSRFPALVVAGPISRRLVISGGFSTYLDRSFTVTMQDTLDLRGQPEPVSDEITSDGAVSDLRLAVAARVHNRLSLGIGLHGLTGSTRVAAIRRFQDSTTYKTSTARDELAFSGIGGSASALLSATPDLVLAAWVRSDSKLTTDIRGLTVAEQDLPFAFGGGVRWRAGTEAYVAGAVAWRHWGVSGSAGGPNAFDTFNWSLGAELGSANSPVRFGVRRGTLPYGPAATAPTEFGLSGGLGRQFSGGRGRLDIGVERLERKGGGLTERVWTFLLGLTVRP